jgi:hypothetical protein
MPVVVKIAEKVKAAGAKGHYCNQSFPEQSTDRIDVKKSAERRINRQQSDAKDKQAAVACRRKSEIVTGEVILQSETRGGVQILRVIR